jgi:hypothetical protein
MGVTSLEACPLSRYPTGLSAPDSSLSGMICISTVYIGIDLEALDSVAARQDGDPFASIGHPFTNDHVLFILRSSAR